ncbi:uncharacterized protein CDAR_574381 [Caerostris darwini]|uniref:Uncharacterized protein n=1 Tax=Caerostris darwini TaxID=1538125 RepID=A0AAV4W2F8_9ARAC|nr:uncharacterized protein CDAR_574381 [Caerostris darwini]
MGEAGFERSISNRSFKVIIVVGLKLSEKTENVVISLENNLEKKSPVVEDEPTNMRTLFVHFSWKSLKNLVCVVCVAFFYQQIAVFYFLSRTYPTATNIVATHPKSLKTPEITVCNRNLKNKTAFCAQYPNQCTQPQNIERFCEKHPNFCVANISELTIPMLGYHTYENVIKHYFIRNLAQEFLFDNTDPKKSYPFKTPWRYQTIRSGGIRHLKGTVAETDSSARYSLYELQMSKISTFNIRMMDKKESFYLWADSQVYLSIHSPVVPSNPFMYGKPLRTGYQ